MPIEYSSRSGEKYYLHVGETKTGKPKYYVARHARGPLADAIPDGFEIYESPKGQVSLRKILPKLIFDEELSFVEQELARIARLKGSRVERKLKILKVYVADRKEDMIKELSAVMPWRWQVGRDNISERFWSYEAQLQFVLVDEQKRLCQTRRYCYLGSIDDWIDIGDAGSLARLTRLYLKHLGRESYYELH
jgi:hypothetical protein